MPVTEGIPLNTVNNGFDSFSVLSDKVVLVKTANFLTYDLTPFVFVITLWGTTLFLNFNFIDKPGEPSRIQTQKFEPENEKDLPVSRHVITLQNFDFTEPTYGDDAVYLTQIHKHDLFVRIVASRPIEKGNCREIVLNFYLSNTDGENKDV